VRSFCALKHVRVLGSCSPRPAPVVFGLVFGLQAASFGCWALCPHWRHTEGPRVLSHHGARCGADPCGRYVHETRASAYMRRRMERTNV
jgi:hypothetical protein